MTLIIAGAAHGRRLIVPAGGDIRPTSDRVREALFSSLESRVGPLIGVRVLDLYAGSGALGLEALSRGAAHVLLVEAEARAIRAIRSNVAALGLTGAEVVHDKAERVLSAAPAEPYDLVLADPPYGLPGDDLTSVLAWLVKGWLQPSAVVVVERSTRAPALRWPTGLTGEVERRYGDTLLWYGRPAG